MKKQSQHKVSQVYLRGFGYKTKSEQWKISTIDLAKLKGTNNFFVSQKSIETITVSDNIYDIQYCNNEWVKDFEDLNGKIETLYPLILNDISLNKCLSEGSESTLIQFVSNIICRNEVYRDFIFMSLNSPNRELFLKLVCVFHEDKGSSFIKGLNEVSSASQLNVVCFAVMDHILNKLATFNYVIIKGYSDRGWITSDSPVVADLLISKDSIFSINTELYFPLSKDYCIFFSHPNAKIKNSILRDVKHKSIIDGTEEIHDMVYNKIRENAQNYIFFPGKVESKKN